MVRLWLSSWRRTGALHRGQGEMDAAAVLGYCLVLSLPTLRNSPMPVWRSATYQLISVFIGLYTACFQLSHYIEQLLVSTNSTKRHTQRQQGSQSTERQLPRDVTHQMPDTPQQSLLKLHSAFSEAAKQAIGREQ